MVRSAAVMNLMLRRADKNPAEDGAITKPNMRVAQVRSRPVEHRVSCINAKNDPNIDDPEQGEDKPLHRTDNDGV